MTTSMSSLETELALTLNDSSNRTFSTGMLDELIAAALQEISRLCPPQFRTDITGASTPALDGTSLDFDLGLGPLMQLVKVEVWDSTLTPPTPVVRLRPSAGEYDRSSQTGWEVWNGVLTLDYSQMMNLNPAVYSARFLRVWGYSAYSIVSAAVTPGLPDEHRLALMDYARLEALKLLAASRDLFSQWMVDSHNTDITLAMLYSQLNAAQTAWRSRARQLMMLREAP